MLVNLKDKEIMSILLAWMINWLPKYCKNKNQKWKTVAKSITVWSGQMGSITRQGKSLCHSFHLAHLRKIEVTGICHLMKFSYLRLNSFTSKPLCHPERIIWEEWSLIALTFSDSSTPVEYFANMAGKFILWLFKEIYTVLDRFFRLLWLVEETGIH